MTAPALRPLKKKTKKGELYVRAADTEGTLQEILSLPDAQLLARCTEQLPAITGYVPSECLVHLVRIRHGESEETQKRLYEILADRIHRRLPSRTDARGNVSTNGSEIADEVMGGFIELLAADLQAYNEQLDFWEVRFNRALKLRLLDAKKKVARQKKRASPIEIDETRGEMSADFVKEIIPMDGFGLEFLERPDDREAIEEAIDALPTVQFQVVHLVRKGLPLYSEKPDVWCASKALGLSDKTVRKHFQLAIDTLKSTIHGEKKS